MDKRKSQSTPYLPRYQSLSPARSPLLETRRFTSLRSVSQPSQKIFYIENSPTRVINSYHVHHSPSPQRTYKIHLCSSKTNHYLTRITRSQSTYDINSSHVYTFQEGLAGKSIKKTAARRAESCEDIYHKAPFFPDMTPSESGVSFGESEEGSTFGGEEDNVSQHSFDSSSAFCEVTVDSELDKGDSDNFSGPDYAGDRTLGVLRENVLSENRDIRKRSSHRSPRELQNLDSGSPLSNVGSRKSELASSSLWDLDKFTRRSEALRVLIPDSEASIRALKDSHKEDGRREVSSKPLAHSTPHVSPGGLGDLKLYAATSWNADNPVGDASDRQEIQKSKIARALFDLETDVGHLSRLEDSSCNSSCSEDNYSDVSNLTISSSVPRKTKLVKKHSDRPASAKILSSSYSRNLLSSLFTEDIESGTSAEAARRGIYSALHNVDRKDSRDLTSSRPNSEYNPDQKTSELARSGVKDDEQVPRDKARNGWWTAYNSNTTKGQEDDVKTRKRDEGETFSGFQRDIQTVKSLTVNIPLITAGKYGQEKLRRLSQTSPPPTRSPNKSPTISSTGTAQTWDMDKNGNQIADHSSQANMGHFKEPVVCELKESDSGEFHKYNNKEEEEKEGGRNQPLSNQFANIGFTVLTGKTDINQNGQNVWEIPSVGKTSQDEKCSQFASQSLDHVHPKLEREEIHEVYNIGSFSTKTQVQETQVSGSDDVEDNFCNQDSFPADYFEKLRETAETIDVNKVINSTHESVLPVNVQIAIETSGKHTTSVIKEQAVEFHIAEGVSDLTNDQQAQDRASTCSDDELGYASQILQGSDKTSDKSCSNADTSLHVTTTQVFQSLQECGKSLCLNKETLEGQREEMSDQEDFVNIISTSTLAGTDTVNEHRKSTDRLLLERSSVYEKDCTLIESQFDSRLFSENSIYSQESNFASSTKEQNEASVGDPGSFNFTQNAVSLIVTSTASKDVIDPISESHDIINDEQQKQERLNSSVGISQVGECGIIEITEKLLEQPITSTRSNENPLESRETPLVGEGFTSGQGKEGNTENSFISLHQHANLTHHCTSSLLSSCDPCNELENCDTPGNFNKHLFDSPDASDFCVSPSDKADLNGITWKQQEILDPNICTNLTRPVVDESIKQSSDVAQRGDSPTNNEENFCTEGSLAFVERGEEFMRYPVLHQKLLIVTEVSSTRVEHIHRTIVDKVVTVRQNVSDSIVGLDSSNGCAYVDVLTEKSVKETIIKEDGGLTITTLSSLSTDTDKQDVVSTDGSSLHGDIINRCSSVTPAAALGIHSALDTHIPSSVPTSHLTAQAPAVDIMKGKIENWNHNETNNLAFAEHVYPSVSQVTTVKPEVIVMHPTETLESAMLSSNHLDNLQVQLSLISGDPSRTNSAANGLEQYQDHAEATSVLKQIVRGDTSNFTQFSHTPRENVNGGSFQDYCSVPEGGFVTFTGKVGDSSIAVDNSNMGSYVDRESYDNEYDYVTTDLPKVTKLYPRSHHHHNLLKPSSLWTLQEEAEGAIDTLSPKPTRKLVIEASVPRDHSGHQSSVYYKPYNGAEYKPENLGNGEITSDSSDFKDSDGHYSSVISTKSDSLRSSSSGREQTPLSETELVTSVQDDTDRISYEDLDHAPQRSESYHLDISKKNVSESGGSASELSSDYNISLKGNGDGQSHSLVNIGALDDSQISNFKSNQTFCVSSPDEKRVADNIALLDKLSASLEQFSSPEPDNEDWKSFSAIGDGLSLSHSRESINNARSSPTTQSCEDDKLSCTSSSLCTLDLDLSLDSVLSSPTPTDFNEGSRYTCTGSAEIKKKSSYHNDIPAYNSKSNLKPDVKLETISKTDKITHSEKYLKFETMLDEFSKDTSPAGVVSEFIFLHEKRPDSTGSSASSTEDLYKTFTNDESEKTQNHVCIVVEDENMNTFRFKRFLKKSHTKRKKGRKLLKFLSKLGCVSEAVVSPTGSPNRRLKLAEESIHTFSTDSMVSSKPRISNPILISSTSFHHQDILKTSPLKNVPEGSTRFASDQSLDSTHSVADSAYSSISESALWAPNSPASQRILNRSFQIPQASTGSVSSVFCAGSTSGDCSFSDNVFSSASDGSSVAASSSFAKDDSTSSLPALTSSSDNDVMSALSDVFDQLDVCVEEVDSALLNRIRYGHVQAKIIKK